MSTELDEEDLQASLSSMRVSAMMAGAIYILICLPLCALVSFQQNASIFRALLLFDIPINIQKAFVALRAPALDMTDVPFFAALGILYGCVCLLFGFITYALRGYGPVKLITSTNGMFFGYLLALLCAEFLFGVKGAVMESYTVHLMKFLYVYLLFIVFSIVRENVSFNRPWRPQFDMVFDGIFGILSSLIIVFGYDESFASILLGPIFLITSFFCMMLAEIAISHPMVAAVHTMFVLENEENQANFEKILETKGTWRKIRRTFGLFWRVFRSSRRRPLDELVVAVRKRLKKLRLEGSLANDDNSTVTITIVPTLAFFMLLVIWPLAIGALIFWLL